MKNLIKYGLFSFLIGFLVLATSCEDKMFSEDYDGNFPIPVITNVSKSGDLPIGELITITGSNFDRPSVSINGVACVVQSPSTSTSVSVLLPRVYTEGPLVISNTYGRAAESTQLFAPIYPDVAITKVSDIPQGLDFTITGTNVDLLTKVFINDVAVSITKVVSPTQIKVSSAGLPLKVGQLVTLTFSGLSNSVPAYPNVNVGFPTIEYKEVVLWDWEDGVQTYSGEGTATVGSAGANTPPGNPDKFFQLRAPGHGWDAATGEMSMSTVPDISSLVTPYLTFYVRTPAGSGGYFQMEDQNGHWRHFDYGWATEGAWKKYSVPLLTGWEGSGEFRASAFKPKLTFKAGNAKTKMDLDIAYVKITEGAYDDVLVPGDGIGNSTFPAKIDIANFEETALYPDLMNGSAVVGSLNFRREGDDMINAFNGSEFFTWTDDGTLGQWGGYWGATLNMVTATTDIKGIPSPYLSFAYNTGAGKGQQYLIVRFFQYGKQLELITKVFGNTDGKWATFQLDIFNTDFENWSKGDTDLSTHYKSLKKLNKDVAIDEIQVIVCRNDNNPVLVSVDEFTITNGPRY